MLQTRSISGDDKLTDDKAIAEVLKELRIIRNLLVSSLVVSGVDATMIAKKILHHSDVSTLSHELPLAQLKKAVTTVKLSNDNKEKVPAARDGRSRQENG
jgi:hypothetical protein